MAPRTVDRRFLLLRASRWFPTGLLIPVYVLFLVERGLTLAQVGIVLAAQGLVVMVLEMPTGGLADAVGRRRVLIMANVFDLIALGIVLAAGSPVWFAVAFAFQGIFRALESGPLDAWYVDAAKEADPDADVERGLSRAGVVLGLAIAAGSVLSGLLVSWTPLGIAPLATPIAVALALRVLDTAMVVALMTETRPPMGRAALAAHRRDVPRIMGSAFRLAATTTLGLLVAVELLWGFGMIAFENLFPIRLSETLGDADRAAVMLGPVSAAAWAASSLGAAVVPWFTRRYGSYAAAAWMRVLQGGTVAAMGALGGPVGLVAAYLGCYALHGAANPVHMTMLHDRAEATNRTTVMSLNSMVGMMGGAIGGVALGAIADHSGVPVAMYLGAGVLAAAAPLYVIAGSRRTRDRASVEPTST